MAMRRPAPKRAQPEHVPLRALHVSLPNYLVAEVPRAAKVRSRIERTHVSTDEIVRRALVDYLWLDADEMQAGAILRPTPPIPADPQVVSVPAPPRPPAPPSFGVVLRQLRRQKKMAVAPLARALQITAQRFYEVERGLRTPFTEPQIRCVAQLLDVAPEPLLAALAT